ncbi:hypothetical protein TIFTF001_055403 [Ficus carica]|uniref:Uncharacterized protein n=1 Tax=Ficus carica TaxID=3494 RepID=A0AA88EGH2_FICCA|nr:hypothetical protein TIFTF001_055403 [Ficus carica]
MRTMITYELAGSKPKRNLELVIEMSCERRRRRRWRAGRKEAERKLFLWWWGLGIWQSGNGS